MIAAGVSAISGGLHHGSYAQADGVDPIMPVAVYVPGHPPHPWYILHGILLTMGHPGAFPARVIRSVSRQHE
jgi:Ni,Fe-hydrogenase III small subunit